MDYKKIAIIDEDKEFLGKLEQVLAASGYTPVVVNDVRLAVDIVVEEKPKVILLELKMLGKNGFELAGEISSLPETEKIPIIAMSEAFKSDPLPLMHLCGITRYIIKPFQPLDVISAIEDVIGEKKEIAA